jgi:hypothetical protein
MAEQRAVSERSSNAWPSRRWRKAVLGVLAAVLVGAGGQFTRPAQPASAYNLMTCCPYYRSQAGHLVAAEWPQHYFDNSSWFVQSIVNGFNAWNGAGTPVFVSVEFVQDSSAQIMYWTDQNTADSSSGGCQAGNTNGYCIWSEMQLVEGCVSGTNKCWQTSGTPYYDQQDTAHEEGHALGLDHSCVSDVLMSGPASPCPNQAYTPCPNSTNCIDTPQQDDIKGMEWMYGQLGQTPPPPGVCGASSPAPLTTPSLPSVPPIAVPSPASLGTIGQAPGSVSVGVAPSALNTSAPAPGIESPALTYCITCIVSC